METQGGLFLIKCYFCGWSEEGTCSQPLFSSIHTKFLVAKAAPPVSADALKVIRAEHLPARVMSLGALRNELISDGGLMVGDIPLHREQELTAKLSAVGVRLETLKHEED
ncbi:hypothetical protein GTP58_21015 [Duganella sp. CY15W]|uniref:hypothetical protein n=1 Tax=Duganella sp. CY15W TaxID=2692172 RepID=UPI00137075D6|nr:hypothetical protein [Duganella sp. CY15W]MYM30821.1 hypothetical protein [Duganella sp. CY15W]